MAQCLGFDLPAELGCAFDQSDGSRSGPARSEDVQLRQLVAVPVDVAKSVAKVTACDFSGRTLLPPC